MKVCNGDERVGWARAFRGKQEAAASRRAPGLVLLLRADPNRPPQRVATIYVLVSDVVDNAPAACAGIRLDVNCFQRVVESDVDEFAVPHAIDVLVWRDGAHGRSYAEVNINVLHKDVLGAVGERRHRRPIGWFEADCIVEISHRAVAHSDVLAFDVDTIGIQRKHGDPPRKAVAAVAQEVVGRQELLLLFNVDPHRDALDDCIANLGKR